MVKPQLVQTFLVGSLTTSFSSSMGSPPSITRRLPQSSQNILSGSLVVKPQLVHSLSALGFSSSSMEWPQLVQNLMPSLTALLQCLQRTIPGISFTGIFAPQLLQNRASSSTCSPQHSQKFLSRREPIFILLSMILFFAALTSVTIAPSSPSVLLGCSSKYFLPIFVYMPSICSASVSFALIRLSISAV